MNIKTNYKEIRNEEKNGLKKCWYKSASKQEKKEELKTLKKLMPEEVEELAKKLWDSPDMQKYIVNTYDFYKTNDGLIIELEKVNKIAIDKTMWYDDEQEDPGKSETNFLIYNRHNTPGRNLKAYLEEKENLQKNGCASGRYDYKGIYFQNIRSDKNYMVGCNWFDDKDYFVRYLTEEEQKDFIQLQQEREEQYIERLKKYYKRYGQKYVRTEGYWVNR